MNNIKYIEFIQDNVIKIEVNNILNNTRFPREVKLMKLKNVLSEIKDDLESSNLEYTYLASLILKEYYGRA